MWRRSREIKLWRRRRRTSSSREIKLWRRENKMLEEEIEAVMRNYGLVTRGGAQGAFAPPLPPPHKHIVKCVSEAILFCGRQCI